jgi:thymidylate kinase
MIIALCGVDGVGKTTIATMLRNRGQLPAAQFLKKDITTCRSIIDTFHAREYEDHRDFNGGSYGAMRAIADTIDFLQYYSSTIQPITHLPESLTVLDRYSLCYISYLSCVAPFIDGQRMLSRVAQADLTVLIESDPSLLTERYVARGGADEDENMELMDRFAKAYREHAVRSANAVLRVNNSGDIEETYEVVLREIIRLVLR